MSNVNQTTEDQRMVAEMIRNEQLKRTYLNNFKVAIERCKPRLDELGNQIVNTDCPKALSDRGFITDFAVLDPAPDVSRWRDTINVSDLHKVKVINGFGLVSTDGEIHMNTIKFSEGRLELNKRYPKIKQTDGRFYLVGEACQGALKFPMQKYQPRPVTKWITSGIEKVCGYIFGTYDRERGGENV